MARSLAEWIEERIIIARMADTSKAAWQSYTDSLMDHPDAVALMLGCIATAERRRLAKAEMDARSEQGRVGSEAWHYYAEQYGRAERDEDDALDALAAHVTQRGEAGGTHDD